MIQSEYSAFDGAKKTVHEHQVYYYALYPKKGNVVVSMQEDAPGTTWAITLLGFMTQLSGIVNQDQAKDIIEQHLVNSESSPLFGGVFIPRIAVVK